MCVKGVAACANAVFKGWCFYRLLKKDIMYSVNSNIVYTYLFLTAINFFRFASRNYVNIVVTELEHRHRTTEPEVHTSNLSL